MKMWKLYLKKFPHKIIETWHARQEARNEEVLNDLRISYHTFRILLANNDHSLDLLLNVNRLLTSAVPSWSAIADETEELLSITYEIVDGLNRLTGNGHAGLYEKHRALAVAIRQSLRDISTLSPKECSCIFLEDLTPSHQSIVGGKAGSLGSLKQSGMPVPAGFVIPSRACREILAKNHLDALISERLDDLANQEVRSAYTEADAEEIRKHILGAEIPEDLASDIRAAYDRLSGGSAIRLSVRSSASVEDHPDHTFAGQFKTVLNVASFDSLIAAVKEVLASNFNVRATIYRFHAGLPLPDYDMAVLCQHMVDARTAGVLFTVDPTAPEANRMLISAVAGLGILAVGGEAPADLYRPLRDGADREDPGQWRHIARKTHRVVPLGSGGVSEEEIPASEGETALLSPKEVLSLVGYGRAIESLKGLPQDIEWAIDSEGQISILQARPAHLVHREGRGRTVVREKILIDSGVCASPGRCVGKARIIQSLDDFKTISEDSRNPFILVLRRSMVDAVRWLPSVEGVIVDFGNPADHLSCVAREYSRPMLTGTGKATEVIQDGQWIVLEADRSLVSEAPESAWSDIAQHQSTTLPKITKPAKGNSSIHPKLAQLKEWIEPLHLTDAYGPTFSIMECRSIHDLIRYAHEKAVLAMFTAGDEVLERASNVVLRFGDEVPFYFHIIDLGGGVIPGRSRKKTSPEDILSTPLRALWRGISTPGLPWQKTVPSGGMSNLFSRSLLDSGSARPVGSQNYAMITRDYLNLNARMDYHFTMIDTVCGLNSRANYIRFRFKGGGTSPVQRQRRARFIGEVLQSLDFFSDQRDDLVTGSLVEVCQDVIQERLVTLGRLLGFSRLLDAAMLDDSVPHKIAQAFLAGDHSRVAQWPKEGEDGPQA
ncbi:PEP/pyruvate-binding domain-containing protein [Desulforhabdus sp. TSK]|uniref:PEP/pyruvate-binding domain-containing protein n=1 Tax=Desulforhabdus sp. TSK TaxID=2925014 RepID=UPI001FC8C1F6|nr:PEP/pyruvate-binding domain-containing protein [Desulforhabdus sp. TSK]GKT07673.1 pyruvate phosphate dikinase PEP/pyruvate binding subunit [Desulforhabdus sp. TSK]